MQSWYAAPGTGERTVIYGRFLLATLSLLALVVAKSDQVELWIASLTYAAFGTVLLFTSKRVRAGRRERLATHAVDLCYAAVYVIVSTSSGPPALALLVFCVLSAAIRLDLRTSAATAIAVVSLYAVSAWTFASVEVVAVQTAVMRVAQLAVIAALMVALAAYLRRLHEDLVRLAAWAPSLAADADDLMADLLKRLADSFGTSRAVMVWSEAEEPWTYVASWSGGVVDCQRLPPGTFDPPVEMPLQTETFFCADAEQERPALLVYRGRKPGRCASAVHPALRRQFAIRGFISFPLDGSTFRGRAFCLDRNDASRDDLRLAVILRRFVTAEMDHYYLRQDVRRTALVEDRVRLARDLHDGLLQSLTAATLQLQAARKLIDVHPAQSDRVLESMHDDLVKAHEDFRLFIRNLRPGPGDFEPVFRLSSHLGELACAVERQWGTRVELSLDSVGSRVPESMLKAAFQLAREAVINAAKHSGARAILVRCALAGETLELAVSDDGLGFPFQGRYTLKELIELKRGPRSLKERIADLGGDLILTSSERGATLEILLPVGAAS